MSDYDTTTAVDEGVLTVTALHEVVQMDLSGEETEYMEVAAEVELPANDDLALALGNALQGWYADQQNAGPPDDVPAHER